MLILAIDTTGFSASIALVKDGREVLFHKTGSGYKPGKVWDDFVILLPAHHQKFLINNFKNLFKKFRQEDIDAVAVSASSGIYNCVLVGEAVVETLAYVYKKPLIEVDHILAHVYSTWLERNSADFNFPILVFSASGSHSGFYVLENRKRCEVVYNMEEKEKKGEVETFLGIGKIFYKIGQKLNIITSSDKTVKGSLKKMVKIMAQGDSYKLDFTKFYNAPLLDLNFSGFMERLDKFLKKEEEKLNKLSPQFVRDVAASFQESITEILLNKIIKIAEMKKAKEIHITGGISENKYLEKKLKQKIKKEKLPFTLRYPVKKEYRLDNAAMIGSLAYYQQKYHIKFINFKPNIVK